MFVWKLAQNSVAMLRTCWTDTERGGLKAPDKLSRKLAGLTGMLAVQTSFNCSY